MTAGPATAPAAGHRAVTTGASPSLLAGLIAAAHRRDRRPRRRWPARSPRVDRTGLVVTLTLWVIAVVGLVVAWHQPGNPIGWLMLGAPAVPGG